MAGRRPELVEPPARPAEPARRRAYVDAEWVEAPVHDRAQLGAGSPVEGPAIVEFAEATCLVRPGWAGEVDGAGTLVLERAGKARDATMKAETGMTGSAGLRGRV